MAYPSATNCILLTLYLSFYFLLPSPTNAQTSNLITAACKADELVDFNPTQCAQIFTSIPNIASASDLPSIATAIIETAINNATDGISLIGNESIKNGTEDERQHEYAIVDCIAYYQNAIDLFKFALNNADSQYGAAYILYVARKNIELCDNALINRKICDLNISSTNKFLKLFIATGRAVTKVTG